MKIVKVISAEIPTVKFITGDGEYRSVDAGPLIRGPWYGELADPHYFSLAKPCDFGWAIGWPGGQAISPDDLLEFSELVSS